VVTSVSLKQVAGFEAMLDHALRAWGVEDRWLASHARKKLAIYERDGWRCTVPGCISRRNLHAHHIVFRSAQGSDAPENLTTLCAFHHQRGVRAGRPPLVRYRSGDA